MHAMPPHPPGLFCAIYSPKVPFVGMCSPFCMADVVNVIVQFFSDDAGSLYPVALVSPGFATATRLAVRRLRLAPIEGLAILPTLQKWPLLEAVDLSRLPGDPMEVLDAWLEVLEEVPCSWAICRYPAMLSCDPRQIAPRLQRIGLVSKASAQALAQRVFLQTRAPLNDPSWDLITSHLTDEVITSLFEYGARMDAVSTASIPLNALSEAQARTFLLNSLLHDDMSILNFMFLQQQHTGKSTFEQDLPEEVWWGALQLTGCHTLTQLSCAGYLPADLPAPFPVAWHLQSTAHLGTVRSLVPRFTGHIYGGPEGLVGHHSRLWDEFMDVHGSQLLWLVVLHSRVEWHWGQWFSPTPDAVLWQAPDCRVPEQHFQGLRASGGSRWLAGGKGGKGGKGKGGKGPPPPYQPPTPANQLPEQFDKLLHVWQVHLAELNPRCTANALQVLHAVATQLSNLWPGALSEASADGLWSSSDCSVRCALAALQAGERLEVVLGLVLKELLTRRAERAAYARAMLHPTMATLSPPQRLHQCALEAHGARTQAYRDPVWRAAVAGRWSQGMEAMRLDFEVLRYAGWRWLMRQEAAERSDIQQAEELMSNTFADQILYRRYYTELCCGVQQQPVQQEPDSEDEDEYVFESDREVSDSESSLAEEPCEARSL